MDFELTDAQVSLRGTVREFASNEIARHAAAFDEQGAIPRDLIRTMADLGLLGICVPAELGGAGMDYLAYIIALEEVCRASAAVGLMMTVNNTLYGEPLMRYGTDAQKRRWLEPAARGDVLGCYCLTEPGSGSDSMAMQTAARKVDGAWSLSGTKQFITNGEIASNAIVFATIDRSKGHRGVTAFLVDRKARGFSLVKKERKMGLLASDTCMLALDDVQVADDQVLGKVGEGYRVAFSTLDAGRVGIAAQALGIAEACFDVAQAYAKQRKQFGGPISGFQAIQWMLADMATEIEAARWMTYRAAALKDAGRDRFTKEASMAKLYASEMGVRVAYRAVQIHGGSGYMKDFPVERFFRDARATPLYEGTSEIQRMVIARQILREFGEG
ncbi:MAG: acyl-CoA dehydrogenase family protein [Chloroflexi bacterium]|nr:acyl-CoA dehydrogenase family protein [Chloroflexota bacterium]